MQLEEIKRGSLTNNEYDYYKLTLPEEVDKEGQIVIELEPDPSLDSINNIVSDPNLYISLDEQHPSTTVYTWASNRYGDETISIGPKHINPFQYYYIAVHCVEKCNYILKARNIRLIELKENKINSFTLRENSVMRFSFFSKTKFDHCHVNVVGSYLASFSAYLAKGEPSSSNTLSKEPIFFNGYSFLIDGSDDENRGRVFELIVDNRDETQELSIWMKYDDENIEIKEAETVFDSVLANNAHCYYFNIEQINQGKDIIISNIIFNGKGFIHIGGFTTLNGNQITSSFKNRENSYPIVHNRVIHITREKLQNYKNFNLNGPGSLNFCFYAERNTSMTIKVYLLEHFQKIQKLNYLYPGIKIGDILPKKSLTRYQMENFDVDNNLGIHLYKKAGNPKLYLYMMNPDRNKDILNFDNFQPLKKANTILEGQEIHTSYYIYLTKEMNKCQKNRYSGKYTCYLNAVIECDSDVDCLYDLYFDHSKDAIVMDEKKVYTNVISEMEYDNYTISIKSSDVTNIAIVLTQNTGKTVLFLNNFVSGEKVYELNNEAIKNDDYMPGLIRVSKDTFKSESLKGTIHFSIEGISYASYSVYYYTYNEEEKIDHLDQDKVAMVLEKGNIIKDILLDNHRFKVYMYDSSKGEKLNLFVTLIETDFVDYELYIFKDLDDFSISNDKIYGYLWKGDVKDYIYIDKDDKKYKENDIFYILIYKRKVTNNSKNVYSTFYLGVTDEKTPFLLNEGIEFKHQLNKQHPSQNFYYYYIENLEDLKISIALLFGHAIIEVKINKMFYTRMNLVEDSELITIPREKIKQMCQKSTKCPVNIEMINDKDYLSYSTFILSVKSSRDMAMVLKQGVVNKKTIMSGEEDHYIVDIKPDKTFGAKITAYFPNGEGQIFVRRALKSELFFINIFPSENVYEYTTSKASNKGFYIIEIPYDEISSYNPCKLLITVKGSFPGYFATKLEYTIAVSSTLNEINTDKNYRFFISQGEIMHYHFRITDNKKRLYISMTNKDADANMYLSFDKYITTITEYDWKNIGSHNEYLDISIDDPRFVKNQMEYIDGDYYLAIHGLNECFFNLFISTQDVKIISLQKGSPAGCTCESDKDNCYFRYENINDPSIRDVFEQELVFYSEFTYGSGLMYGKLYPNGNMEEIIKNLPSITNNDNEGEATDLLYVRLKRDNPKYTFSSIFVVGVQCKEKSLFDIGVVTLDRKSDMTKVLEDYIYLKINQDNVFYFSDLSGKTSKLIYYMSKDEDFNFQVKGLLGTAKIHAYTNKTKTNHKFSEDEDKTVSINDYRHISEFNIDSSKENNRNYFGSVSKQYGRGNYFYLEVIPFSDCIINIIVNYNDDMHYLPLNKEINDIISGYNYYGYFDFLKETEEVIITVTSVDLTPLDIILKKNVINKDQTNDQSKYSKPNSYNYDIKGTTESLTSSLSLRIKNVPKELRENSIVRVLLNIESRTYSSNKKIKILITPVINNINRLNPLQNTYYFSNFEKSLSDKNLYLLNSLNKEDNLMVIEISLCKGSFLYALVDSPPLDSETYNALKKRQVPSKMYASNGKNIIIVRNIEPKDYYLMVYGNNNDVYDIFINENKEEVKEKTSSSQVDLLFNYYTTNEKTFNYLFTQDSFTYETNSERTNIKMKLPELKKRDILGREKYADYMNYTVVVSEKRSDYHLMESTCYLNKLIRKRTTNDPYNYITAKYDKETNTISVDGFIGGKTYYLNVLAKNTITGESVTYKPIMLNPVELPNTVKAFVTILLTVIFVMFFYCTFSIYRKYRIERAKITYDIEGKSESTLQKAIGSLKNINLNVVKKKYNSLSEDQNTLNEE